MSTNAGERASTQEATQEAKDPVAGRTLQVARPEAHEAGPRFDAERFNNLASGIQSLVVVLSVVAGAIWGAVTLQPILEQRRAEATLAQSEAEARSAALALQQRLRRREVVQVAIEAAAYVLQTGSRTVAVTVRLKNDGEESVRLPFDGQEVQFYVAKVETIRPNGEVVYSNRLDLKVDYVDKTITWFRAHPGDAVEARAIQSLPGPGLYLARYSSEAPADSALPGREFSSEVYFEAR